jgi:hypothetical protein
VVKIFSRAVGSEGHTMHAVIRRRWLPIGIAVLALIGGWLFWDAWTSNPVGRWFDAAGNAVPAERLEVWTGSEHCDTSSTKFMALTWPLGRPATSASRIESYVWEPPDDFMRPDAVTPGTVEAMPPDARNTGLHRGDLTLWVSESHLRKAVFVTDGGEIQRWAFAPGAGYCF